MSTVPSDLHYSEEHEWVRVIDATTVRFGITDHAQDALGDIVFVSLPAVGEGINAGQSCGEVESTKSVSEIYAPLAGEVVARNAELDSAPETINADAYGKGWMVEIRPADPDALDGLLTAALYRSLVEKA